MQRLPYSFARRHQLILRMPDDASDSQHELAYVPPLNLDAFAEVQRYCSGEKLEIRALEENEFEQLINESYQSSSGEAANVAENMDGIDLESLAENVPVTEDLMEQEENSPIVKLINALLSQAIQEKASDIHIETFEKHMSVRMRVDGVLREVLQPKRELAPLLVSRIKVMANLDIAEKRVPQDGRIALRFAGREVDVRVSTMPSSHGERVVLRLLDKNAGNMNLNQLGMQNQLTEQLNTLIHKPHGIILVTGPTGSGKTTTLYASLTRLNNHSRNILTVEDPVEYQLDGIGQTQVNPKVEMTFARGLRAILRQDPDVVMVGEIRDQETAEIAIQASLTGHLVLSTLHTNSAIGAITRLHDMGVEPFLLSSSLIGVLAQRLVRRLCHECKEPHPADATDLALMELKDPGSPVTIYKPKGCEHCNYQGYKGRLGLYELLTVDHQVGQMIHDNAAEHQIEKYVRSQSVPSLRADGVQRVLEGSTSLEEVLRVTREGDDASV